MLHSMCKKQDKIPPSGLHHSKVKVPKEEVTKKMGLQTFGETPNVTDVWENAKLSGKGFGEIFGRLGKLVLLGKLFPFRGN